MAKKVPTLDVVISERIVINDAGWMGEHVLSVREWTITITGTRYECVIRECPCGLRRQTGLVYKHVDPCAPKEVWRAPREIERVYSVALINCTCKSEAHRGPKPSERDRVCHGWHRARIDKFFDHLAKHGTAKTERPAPVGIPRGNLMVPFVGVGYVHRDVANMTHVVAMNKHTPDEWASWHKRAVTTAPISSGERGSR